MTLLHVAVVRGVSDSWARGLLLAHLGLLLLWQPFVRAEQRVSPTQGLVLALGAFAVMLRLDWWLLENADHRGVQATVRELNRVYRDMPALWQLDHEPRGERAPPADRVRQVRSESAAGCWPP